VISLQRCVWPIALSFKREIVKLQAVFIAGVTHEGVYQQGDEN